MNVPFTLEQLESKKYLLSAKHLNDFEFIKDKQRFLPLTNLEINQLNVYQWTIYYRSLKPGN